MTRKREIKVKEEIEMGIEPNVDHMVH